jgi:protein-disulfide isomerase
MNSKRVVYVWLLIAALSVAACSSAVTPKPTATLPPTATPTVSGGEVPMGFTEDGAPYRGNPDAPVTLVEYSEFL